MQSVIVHYQEIALKGKNRPWFVARLVRNLRAALSDLDVRRCACSWGASRSCSAPTADWSVVRDRLSRVFGVGNFAKAGRAPLEVEAIAAAILERSRRHDHVDVPAVGAPGRQALSFDLARDRARGRRPDQGSAGVDGESVASRADDSRRDADRRGVLLLRQGSRAPAGFRSAPAGASCACCRGASTRRSRRGG